jgi:hypothetical protein
VLIPQYIEESPGKYMECGGWLNVWNQDRNRYLVKRGSIRLSDDPTAEQLMDIEIVRDNPLVLVPSVSEWAHGSRLWDLVASGKVSLRDGKCLILGGPTEIVQASVRKRNFTICSIGNYHTQGLHGVLAEQIGDRDAERCLHHPGVRYGDTQAIAEAVGEWIVSRIHTWRESGLGNWRYTLSQLSHTAARKVIGEYVVTPTERPEVRLLERDACYGGRAEVIDHRLYTDESFQASEWKRSWEEVYTPNMPEERCVDGPIYHWDIKSCYPTVMIEHKVPARLIDFRGMSSSGGIIDEGDAFQLARVKIRTASPDYPVRVAEDYRSGVVTGGDYVPGTVEQTRTIYPVGEFWTVLCGEELRYAWRSGHIQDVRELATYSVTDRIQPWMYRCLNERVKASSSHDRSSQGMWKSLANSYLGKFAARSSQWETLRDYPAQGEWCHWTDIDADTGEISSYRAIGEVVQRKLPKADIPSSHPILYAAVTGYARRWLAQVISAAGPCGVIAYDTDGIHLNKLGSYNITAKSVLAEQLQSDHLGWPFRLEFKGQASAGRFWGPKHYWTTLKGWVLAGFGDGQTLMSCPGPREVSRIVTPSPSPDTQAKPIRIHTYSCSLRPSAERIVNPNLTTEPRKLGVII